MTSSNGTYTPVVVEAVIKNDTGRRGNIFDNRENFPTWQKLYFRLAKFSAAVTITWAKLIESVVVYLHIFADATELDILHVPRHQSRKSRRQGKK